VMSNTIFKLLPICLKIYRLPEDAAHPKDFGA